MQLSAECEHAMERAVVAIHAAEDASEARERDSYRALAQTYVSMARELRIGSSKRSYGAIKVERVKPPSAVDVHDFEEEDEREAAPV